VASRRRAIEIIFLPEICARQSGKAPWDTAAGFSYDGSGEFVSTARFQENPIAVFHRVFLTHSLGSLCVMTCEFIDCTENGEEGKEAWNLKRN
jgi:hypothetical protein